MLDSASASAQGTMDEARRGMSRRLADVAINTDHMQDRLYLTPLIKQIEMEAKEREDLEVMTLNKSKK